MSKDLIPTKKRKNYLNYYNELGIIMATEDRELLLKDLCARLPYGVKIDRALYGAITLNERHIESFKKGYDDMLIPYLRPMSSMTEEERKEYEGFIIHREHVNAWGQEWDIDCFSFNSVPRLINWLNAHHFDYRGLIPRGSALEAPEGMYNNKIKEE